MTRQIKIIGVTLVAVFALAAAGASSATAAESLLTPAASPAFIEGEQAASVLLKLTGANSANAVSIKCTTATLKATVENTTVGGVTGVREGTATPTLAGCTLAGLTAEVKTHSCTLTVTNTTTPLTGKGDITNCPSTAPLEAIVPSTGCIITGENQGPLSSTTAANNTGTVPDDVTLTLNISGIAYAGNSKCPANIVGKFTNGDLTGSYTVKAYKDSGGVKGAQVNLTAD